MNFEEDAGTLPSNEELNIVSELADQQVELEAQMAHTEAELKSLKERHRNISEKALPDAMTACGLETITLSSGAEILIKADIAVSIKKDNEPKAFKWLGENGHGSIIKTEFKMLFGKDTENDAANARAVLEGSQISYTEKTSIHAGTLKAFCKSMLEDGKELPEAIGIFEYKKAKVKLPK